MWDTIWPYLAAVIPTICVATLFYFLMKNILEADRKERLAQSKWEAEQDRRRKSAAAPERGPEKS
jgi:peptidoglycan/LPS O-acetylase OafA/YrhL